jgi:hypothetical protein
MRAKRKAYHNDGFSAELCMSSRLRLTIAKKCENLSDTSSILRERPFGIQLIFFNPSCRDRQQLRH